MTSLAAFIASLKFYKKYNVIDKNKSYGERLIKYFNNISSNLGLIDIIKMDGLPCSPFFYFKECILLNEG